MAEVHGALNIVGGAWPLVHRRSFEAVFGPKHDRWLMYTVAGLLVSVGYAQVRAGTTGCWEHGRRIGVATSATLLAVDLIYVRRGVLRKTYLLDAAMEAGLLAGWACVPRPSAVGAARGHAPGG